jgi:hypothetical protein
MKFPLVVFHNYLHFSDQVKGNSTTHLFATQQRNVIHFFHYLYRCSNNTLYSHCKFLFSVTSSNSFSFYFCGFFSWRRDAFSTIFIALIWSAVYCWLLHKLHVPNLMYLLQNDILYLFSPYSVQVKNFMVVWKNTVATFFLLHCQVFQIFYMH